MSQHLAIAVDRSPPEHVICKRRDVLNKLQNTLEALEAQQINYPIPKALLRGEKCECIRKGPAQHGAVRYSPTAYLDGSDAIPFKIDESSKIKWTPKYPVPCQNPHPNMTCYCVPQVFDPDLCDCPEADAIKDQYKKKDPNVGKGDDDYCTSGRAAYNCPPDANHRHWSPHKGSCVWPKPCMASCFDHSDRRDWINVVPNYRMYMQSEDTSF